MSKSKSFNVRKMAVVGVLGALTAILGMTPIGLIPIGPTKATILHIPVIIGAIIEGPVVGAFVGLIFGLFSVYSAITAPTVLSFAFLNPLVSVLPRILIGITTYYVYKAIKNLGFKKTLIILNIVWLGVTGYLAYWTYTNIRSGAGFWIIAANIALIIITVFLFYITNKKAQNNTLSVVIATIAGTLTNTGLVLTMMFLLYASKFEEAMGLSGGTAGKAILGIGVANGIPEIIIAILIVTSVVSALKRNKPE